MLNWFRDHPWVGTAFAAGMAGGLILRLPVFPYSLPESTANIVGAAVGAAFAVFAAAWIAQHKERSRDRMSGRAIKATVSPLLNVVKGVQEVLNDLEPVAGKQEIADLHAEARRLQAYAEQFSVRLTDMQPLFLEAGGRGVIAFATLKSCVLDAAEAAKLVLEVNVRDEDYFLETKAEAADVLKTLQSHLGQAMGYVG